MPRTARPDPRDLVAELRRRVEALKCDDHDGTLISQEAVLDIIDDIADQLPKRRKPTRIYETVDDIPQMCDRRGCRTDQRIRVQVPSGGHPGRNLIDIRVCSEHAEQERVAWPDALLTPIPEGRYKEVSW